jgi:hypothetical protein
MSFSKASNGLFKSFVRLKRAFKSYIKFNKFLRKLLKSLLIISGAFMNFRSLMNDFKKAFSVSSRALKLPSSFQEL